MRKIYSLIMAAAVTATINATAVASNNDSNAIKPAPKGLVSSLRHGGLNNQRQNAQNLNAGEAISAKAPLAKNGKHLKVSSKAAKQLAEELSTDYITEAPEGDAKVFYRNSLGYYSFYGYIFYEMDYGSVGEVVFADNNEVYIKNPISSINSGTYLKGTIDGDIITVNFPQPIYQESYYGTTYNYYAAALKYEEVEATEDQDAYATYAFNEDSQQMQFKYEDGKITSYSDNPEQELLGLIYYDPDGESADDTYYWMGYGDNQYEFLPFDDEVVEVPEDANVSQKAIVYDDGFAQIGNVAQKGDDVYIQGLIPGYDEAWVKGSVSDGKVSFPSEQYFGISDYYNHFAYFYGGTKTVTYYESFDYYYTTYNFADDYSLNYDSESGKYSATSEDGVAICNLGKSVEYVQAAAAVSSIHEQGDVSDATPADPIITGYSDYIEDYGYGYIFFNFPNTDTEGNVLPTDKLYYNFLADGEPCTLYADDYWYQEEDEITDIPFSYTDSYDVYFDRADHSLYFYFEGAESIGIQTIYRPEEGKEFRSNPVSIELSAVKAIANDNKQISSETYFDLTGCAVANPDKGLFIKKINYSDGSSKAVKIIK